MTYKEYVIYIRNHQFWLADLICERDKAWTQIDIKCQTDEERKEAFKKFKANSTVQYAIDEIAWLLRHHDESYIKDTHKYQWK